MRQLVLLFILFCFCFNDINAQLITVKQDGTGQFTTIQAAVYSANQGDTVLVWPGTYNENILLSDKCITLASLMITTGDTAYKYSTIIDGNNNGSCIAVTGNQSNAKLYGFTLQNGSGHPFFSSGQTEGGGIFIGDSSTLYIVNSIIKNNCSTLGGGGIYCRMYSKVILEGTSVFNNYTYGWGGGLLIGYEAQVIFSQNNLCNFYLNYASRGTEIIKTNSSLPMNVFVDTFTVKNPDRYYLTSVNSEGFFINDFSYSILHEKITAVDSNLYVNPISGNNNNSGLSPEQPLKTIAFAYTKIIPDSNIINTIYLADGIYSDSSNGEKFPLNIRSFINVVGHSRNNTILDGEYKSKILNGNNETSYYTFSKMTIKRGTYMDYSDFGDHSGLVKCYLQNDNIYFDSILFTEGWSDYTDGSVNIIGSGNVNFVNCEFISNKGGATLRLPMWDQYDTVFVNNCKFFNNKPDTNNPEHIIGRALYVEGGNGMGLITNSLFVNNDYNVFVSVFPSTIYLVNCTFNENSKLDNHLAFWLDQSIVHIINSISVKNSNYFTFGLSNNEHDNNTILNIRNSLIEKGTDNVIFSQTCQNNCYLYYDTTNIDTDPLFYGGEEFPYNLSAESPCIDAGTLDLPQFILDNMPATDLAGNPRIFNGKIDMGAYEWNPTVGTEEHQTQNAKRKTPNLKVSPNSFTGQTAITVLMQKTADIDISIYNINGLHVKTLMHGNQSAGTCTLFWNGTDDNGTFVPAGVYIAVLKIDGKETESVKVVKK